MKTEQPTQPQTAQHTAGPWRVFHDPATLSVEVRTSPPFRHIPQHIADCGATGNDMAEANAKLIASVPDLLETCQRLVNIATHPRATLAQIRMIANDARAVIEKA